MIKLYIYKKDSGMFVCEDTGQPNDVVHDIASNSEDFTLTPPPNYFRRWYWVDSAWQDTPKEAKETEKAKT